MFLRRFTDFVLQNRVQAMATAFVTAFIPVIGTISILIAALVTLRKGALEGALILIASTVPFLIGYFASYPTPDQMLMATAVLIILIISNILTWFFAVLLRLFSSWSFTLEVAALAGVIVVGAVHILNPDIQAWWAQQLNDYFAKTAEVVDKLKPNTAIPEALTSRQQQAIAVAKQFATGFVVVSVLFNALLQLLIARWWQAVIFNPGGLRPELYQIRLGHVAGVVFALGFILAYLGMGFAIDAMPVLCVAFFIAGLSLFHNLVSTTKVSWLWLIMIYAGIIWLFPLSIVIISIVALFDTGFDFRKRFKKMRGE